MTQTGDQKTYLNMLTDWTTLAKNLGSIQEDGSECGGDDYAKIALDQILGDEWIENTVDHIISFKKGSELAMNCLRYLGSTKATTYAYKIYQTSKGEKAGQAVWLIKQIANPISADWIEEFLNDNNVMHLGLGVLDQLIWTNQLSDSERISNLLKLADDNSEGQLKDQINFIKGYLSERSKK
jgi:hypothetical protein